MVAKKTRLVTIRFTESEFRRVRKAARKEKRTRADCLRLFLLNYLARVA